MAMIIMQMAAIILLSLSDWTDGPVLFRFNGSAESQHHDFNSFYATFPSFSMKLG